nr:aldo/keto reductase [uncultured Schaedlerella sp.]
MNQVLYHLGSRGIEYSLKPWMDAHDVALMAYCPLAQAGELQRGLVEHPVLNRIAAEHQATVLQLLLAFVLQREHTIAIPRSGKSAHVEANAGALDIRLSEQELAEIDQAFPAPDHKTYLDIV